MATKTSKRKPSAANDYGDVISGRIDHFVKIAFTALANHYGMNMATAVDRVVVQYVISNESELRDMGIWNDQLEALKEEK